MNRKKNKGLASRVTTRAAFYIFFGIVYMGFIWVLHQYLPLYHKSNDLWNDRTFSEPLEGELFPDNIILIDIDPWPYYKDNRDEANQARDNVVNHMIEIIDLIKDKVPFIGIDMTFESFANKKIMEQLFTRIKNNKNIYQAVEFDRKKRELKFPRNYFWNRIRQNMEKIKKRLMVINLEKYKDEPVRRYKTFYNVTFDDTGAVYDFPSMGTIIAKMIKKYYLGDSSKFEIPDRIKRRPGHRASRFRFRYLIQNIKEDYKKYNVFSLQRAKEWFFASGSQGALFEKTAPWTPAKTFNSPSGKKNLKVNRSLEDKSDLSKCIVIFGRMDPDPDGRDRFSVCASIKRGNTEQAATLPGVLIHINAAQSILLGEDIRPMGIWKVLIYFIVLLVVLIPLHIFIEAVVTRWKPGWSHWYPEIFLFLATVLVIILLDYLLKKPGNYNLEIPMFTFYMFAIKFYPAIGVFDWFYRHFLLRWCKQKGNKDLKEEFKNVK